MNSRAYSEVYQVLQYLPESEYKMIPKWQIDVIKDNMEMEAPKIITVNTNFDDVVLSNDAKTLLLTLFYMNIANEEQKLKIDRILMNEEKRQSEEYRKIFNQRNNYNINNNIQSVSTIKEIKNEETALVKIDEEKWSYKVKKFLNKILQKLKINK